jgi:hypothetical protein
LQETPDLHGAFPRLDADEIDRLAEYGTRRPTRSDETLVSEGDRGTAGARALGALTPRRVAGCRPCAFTIIEPERRNPQTDQWVMVTALFDLLL